MASARQNVPGWFWLVAGIAFLWEAMGCYMYVAQVTMSAADLAALPAQQRELWEAMPGWVTGAYAVAVWAGLAGAIGLLLRHRLARPPSSCRDRGHRSFGWTFFATTY